MNEKLGAVAIIIALIATVIGGFAYISTDGEVGPMGPKGETGPPGEDATGVVLGYEWNGTKIRFKDIDGIWSEWVDLKGDTGSSGSGSTGQTGPQGPPGEDGADGSDNELPIVTDITPEGCIGLYDDWIFSITVDDPEGDLMKIEFFIYVNLSWFEGGDLGFIPYYMGTHIWLPVLNEVGYDGTYAFNGTNIKEAIDGCIGIPECMNLIWRYDVTDRIVSSDPIYTPSCYMESLNFNAHHCYDGFTNFTVKIDDVLIYTHNTSWSEGWEEFNIDLNEFDILCCCEYHNIEFEVLTSEETCFEPCGELAIDWVDLNPSCCEGYVDIGTEGEIGHNLIGWGEIGNDNISCCDWSEYSGHNWRTVWAGSEDEPTASLEIECICEDCLC